MQKKIYIYNYYYYCYYYHYFIINNIFNLHIFELFSRMFMLLFSIQINCMVNVFQAQLFFIFNNKKTKWQNNCIVLYLFILFVLFNCLIFTKGLIKQNVHTMKLQIGTVYQAFYFFCMTYNNFCVLCFKKKWRWVCNSIHDQTTAWMFQIF